MVSYYPTPIPVMTRDNEEIIMNKILFFINFANPYDIILRHIKIKDIIINFDFPHKFIIFAITKEVIAAPIG